MSFNASVNQCQHLPSPLLLPSPPVSTLYLSPLGMASVLTMTMPVSQSPRALSPMSGHSDRNSLVSSSASFHSAPGYVSRSSLRSSRSSSANTIPATSPPTSPAGTDAVNPIHILAETAEQNGTPTEDQLNAIRIAAGTYHSKAASFPEAVTARVGETIATVTHTVTEKLDRERPSTPPNGTDRTPSEASGSPTTIRLKPDVGQDAEFQRRIPIRSGTYDFTPMRRPTSAETSITQSTSRTTNTPIPIPQRISRIDTQANGVPHVIVSDTASTSSSAAHRASAGDAFLHPSTASSSNQRPHRRNTTGSVVPPTRPSRHLASHTTHQVPMVESPTLLDPDILEQADQIRRERQNKRAKAQQEAEAALTRAHSKKSVDEDKVLVGNLIGEDHVNYVLMYNMLTGIRIAVSRCQAKIKRPLTDEDFTARHKFSFDMFVSCFSLYLSLSDLVV